jgi:phage gpG-like protein
MSASALAFTLKVDEISPSLSALAEPALRRRCVQAMATVVESFAVRAFDEPSLRPTSWPARKPSKATNPLLIKSGNLRQSIHTQVLGNDSAKVGSPAVYAAVHQLGGKNGTPPRPFFPVVENQLTGNADAECRDVVDALIGGAAGNA